MGKFGTFFVAVPGRGQAEEHAGVGHLLPRQVVDGVLQSHHGG